MAALNRAGSCRKAKWLVFGKMSRPAPGIVAAMYSVCDREIASSWSPSATTTCARIFRRSASIQFGSLAHMWVICATNAPYSFGVADRRAYSSPARADEGSEGRVLIGIRLNAVRARVRGEGEHPPHPLGMADRQIEPENGTVAPADDVGALDLQHVEQGNDVVSHKIVAEGPVVASASPMAAALDKNHAVIRGERRDLIAPVIRVGEAAVQEHHRCAFADARVVQADPVDQGSASCRSDVGLRSRRQGLPSLNAERRTPTSRPARHSGAQGHELGCWLLVA